MHELLNPLRQRARFWLGFAPRPNGPLCAEVEEPPLAQALAARDGALDAFTRWSKIADVVRMQIGPGTGYIVSRPDAVQTVLTGKMFGKQTLGMRKLRLVLGNGLVTSDGDFWLRQRRLAQPSFARNRMRNFAPQMTRAGRALIDQWSDGGDLDIGRGMMSLTLRIAGETLFGADVERDAPEVEQALSWLMHDVERRISEFVDVPWAIPTTRNRTAKAHLATLDRVVGGVIKRRQGAPPKDDLLGRLMSAVDEDTGERMDALQLRDEVMTLILAGHETTATALTWTLGLLAHHPEEQAALRQDLRRALGDDEPSVEQVRGVERLANVLSEAMRLYPPAWILSRSVHEEVEVGGYPIPVGASMFVLPHIVHRLPDLWPEPERFKPERFTKERRSKIHRFAYIPFAGGRRKCIGDHFALLEMLLVLAPLIRDLEFEPLGPLPDVEPLVTLRPKGGLRLRVRRASR